MIDGESVALGPVAVELADVVESGRIVIRRLEVLGLEHPVGVCEVELSERLFSLSTAESGDVGGRTNTSTTDGHSLLATHGVESSLDKGAGSRLKLGSGSGHHLRLAVDQDGRLVDIVGLALDLRLMVNLRLSLDEILLLKGHLADSWLLRIQTLVFIFFEFGVTNCKKRQKKVE